MATDTVAQVVKSLLERNMVRRRTKVREKKRPTDARHPAAAMAARQDRPTVAVALPSRYPDSRQNQSPAVLTNVFLHLPLVKVRRHALAIPYPWGMGGLSFFPL